LWILSTMIVWLVSALAVFIALPEVRKDGCAGLSYCNHLRALLCAFFFCADLGYSLMVFFGGQISQ
jgi:hypothetical protein